MALSVGLLSTIIMFVIIAHAGAFAAYYFHLRKQPAHSSRFTVTGITASRMHWLMIVLMFLTFILGIYAAAACNFLIAAIPNIQNPQETLDWGIGFSHIDMPPKMAQYFNQDGGCESLDTDTGIIVIGNHNSTAKSFSAFNCILTSVGVFLVSILTCKKKQIANRDLIWLNLRILMYISLWCAILSFYLRENATCDVYTCSLGIPGYVQIVNVVFLIIINSVLFFTDPGQERFMQSLFLSAEDARQRDSVMTPDVNVTDDPTEYPATRESMFTPKSNNNNTTRMAKAQTKLSHNMN